MTIGISIGTLDGILERLKEEHPDARLVKNQIGNLSVMKDGEYIGFIDLYFGELDIRGRIQNGSE